MEQVIEYTDVLQLEETNWTWSLIPTMMFCSYQEKVINVSFYLIFEYYVIKFRILNKSQSFF
jgi:hypothetical protein